MRLKPESRKLLRAARNVTSQNGEDGIIARIFEILPPANRWCVEFGAHDGRHASNTWDLIRNQGWTGVLIEADRARFELLNETFRDMPQPPHLVHAFIALEGETSLDTLLAGVGAPTAPDLMSIDIDGDDWHVWHSLRLHRPRVVVIEFNPTIDNDILFVQDYGAFHGSSLLAMIELGKEKGYELVAATDFNAFFVERELFERFGIEDNRIDAMYYPINLIKIFQGFDGTMFPVGDLRLLWKGPIALAPEDFQVVPKSMRR